MGKVQDFVWVQFEKNNQLCKRTAAEAYYTFYKGSRDYV